MSEPTARDRIEAVRVAAEAEQLANEASWSGWLLRPFARLLRWMAKDHPEHDDVY